MANLSSLYRMSDSRSHGNGQDDAARERQGQSAMDQKLNMTVKGVSAAFYGMTLATHAAGLATPRSPEDPVLAQDYRIFLTGSYSYRKRLPTFGEVYNFVYKLFRRAQIEPECLIAAVIYAERLLSRRMPGIGGPAGRAGAGKAGSGSPARDTSGSRRQDFFVAPIPRPAGRQEGRPRQDAPQGFLMYAETWERIVFTCIMIASKTWDDISCSSRSFALCATDFSLQDLNRMERIACRDLEFNLFLTSEDYRTYYYMLKDIWLNLKVDESMRPARLARVPDIQAKNRWGTEYVFCGMGEPGKPGAPSNAGEVASGPADVKQRISL